MTLWVCRAGRSGEYENYFLEKQVIAVTWSKIDSDMTVYDTWEKLKEALTKIYPDELKAIPNYTGQLFPFFQTMKIGEKVLLPSKIKLGTIYVGTIKSDCTYQPDNLPYSHIRKVEWSEETILRKNLDADILHSLGAYLTIFRIDEEKEKRIFSTLSTKKKNKNDDNSEESPNVYSNLENDALEQISATIIQKFKGYDMQKVIESIFRAKGYETYVSKGADKGIDVLASNGPLGFGGTKICIQVKTEDHAIGMPVLVELIGTMNNVGADYGLLVSWNGFMSSIDSERRDKFFKIKFWDHKDIVKEFLDNYDQLDDWIKAKVPLKKIWVPEINDDPDE